MDQSNAKVASKNGSVRGESLAFGFVDSASKSSNVLATLKDLLPEQLRLRSATLLDRCFKRAKYEGKHARRALRFFQQESRFISR